MLTWNPGFSRWSMQTSNFFQTQST